VYVYDHASFSMADTRKVAGPAPTDSLYKRIGGYDTLAAVTDDFIGRLLADPQVKRFFSGVSGAHAQRIRQMVVDKLCADTGGPCVYIGQDMNTAHKGLGVSNSDWEQAVKLLVQSLDKFKVGDREKTELLGALNGLKSDIVER
ncbi:MAG: group I truncated hemoglobin, partial [bacterium]